MSMTPQQTVQGLLDEFVAQGTEWGAQAVASVDGKLVADACAGTTGDPAGSQKVNGDTLFPVFSTTKGIAATVIHRLVERGLLDYDTPIAEYWPEFAAHGKGGITLRHALNHTAGLQFMPRGIGYTELDDWDTMCAAMVDARPASPPGEQMAYHAVTYSWTVGEPARRVTGRSFPELVQSEVCAPLAITGLFVGLPDAEGERVAILGSPANPATNSAPADEDTPQSIPPLIQPLHAWMNRPDARRACIPASNGIMSARAIARHYAALLPGGVDGVELLPPARVRVATERQRASSLRADEIPAMNQALGYNLGNGGFPGGFGHGGFGGTSGFADPESGLAFGFTRNYFGHPEPVERLARAILAALG